MPATRRVVCLATDGFGGFGGIALHCRHTLSALSEHPTVEAIHCIARIPPEYHEPAPRKVTISFAHDHSLIRYLGLIADKMRSRQKTDLVLTEHINLLPFAALLASWHGAKLALVVHGYESWTRPAKLMPGLLGRIDQVISVSAVTRERFLSWSGLDPALVSVIPNPLPDGIGPPGDPPDQLVARYALQGKTVLLTVGRLDAGERAKGFDETIQALASLKSTMPELRYLIVGEGDDRTRLRALAHSLDVSDQVIFAGRVDDSEKTDHYRLADVYVMPSRLEGFGYVFLEAMACGLPVIASRIDGGRDTLLNGELGQLVDPDRPEELVAAIKKAIGSPRHVPPQLAHFSRKKFARHVQSCLLDPPPNSRY